MSILPTQVYSAPGENLWVPVGGMIPPNLTNNFSTIYTSTITTSTLNTAADGYINTPLANVSSINLYAINGVPYVAGGGTNIYKQLFTSSILASTLTTGAIGFVSTGQLVVSSIIGVKPILNISAGTVAFDSANVTFTGNLGVAGGESVGGDMSIAGDLIVQGYISSLSLITGTLTSMGNNLQITNLSTINGVPYVPNSTALVVSTFVTLQTSTITTNYIDYTSSTVNIGLNAGIDNPGEDSIAIGYAAGQTNSGQFSIAIGQGAGLSGSGDRSVALGYLAGGTNIGASTIVISAQGAPLNGTTVASLYIAPIRQMAGSNLSTMSYNNATKEVTYGLAAATGAFSTMQYNNNGVLSGAQDVIYDDGNNRLNVSSLNASANINASTLNVTDGTTTSIITTNALTALSTIQASTISANVVGTSSINVKGYISGVSYTDSQIDTNVNIGSLNYVTNPNVTIFPGTMTVGTGATYANAINMTTGPTVLGVGGMSFSGLGNKTENFAGTNTINGAGTFNVNTVGGVNITTAALTTINSATGISILGGGGVAITGGLGVVITGGAGLGVLAGAGIGIGTAGVAGGGLTSYGGNLNIYSGAGNTNGNIYATNDIGSSTMNSRFYLSTPQVYTDLIYSKSSITTNHLAISTLSSINGVAWPLAPTPSINDTYSTLYTSSFVASTIYMGAQGVISTTTLQSDRTFSRALSSISSINDVAWPVPPVSAVSTFSFLFTSSLTASTIIMESHGLISTPVLQTPCLLTISSINGVAWPTPPPITLSSFQQLYTSSLNVSSLEVSYQGHISTPLIYSPAVSSLSSINSQPYVYYPGSQSTISSFNELYVSSILVSTLVVDSYGRLSTPVLETNLVATYSISSISSINEEPYIYYPGLQETLSTFNELYTSSLNVSSIVVEASGSISTPALLTNYISTFAISGVSSINDEPYLSYPGIQSTISSFIDLTTVNLYVENIYASTITIAPDGFIDTALIYTCTTSVFKITELSSINNQPYVYYPGLQTTLSTFNEIYTSSLNVSSIVVEANGSISTPALLTNFLSTFAISGVSSINDEPYVAFAGYTSTLSSFNEFYVSSLVASTIVSNGFLSTPYLFVDNIELNNDKVILGKEAGTTSGDYVIAIGSGAGNTTQYDAAIAIGVNAGRTHQSTGAIAIGGSAASFSQGSQSIAIGQLAGYYYQSDNCIAIGAGAGLGTPMKGQHRSTIILSVLGSDNALNSISTGSFYVAPVRGFTGSDTSNERNIMNYNYRTHEITYEENLLVSTFNNLFANHIYTSTLSSFSISTNTIDTPAMTNVSSINDQPYVYYPGLQVTLSTFNELYTSSLTVSSIVVNTNGSISTPALLTNYISTFAISAVSSINDQPYVAFAGYTSTLSTFNELYTSSLTVSSIVVKASGSISTPALLTNFLSTFAISGVSSINDEPYVAFAGYTSTLSTFKQFYVSSLVASTIQVDGYISTPLVITNKINMTPNVGIGTNVHSTITTTNNVAIGFNTGYLGQGGYSVAIGDSAGFFNLGIYNIAIGSEAGRSNVEGMYNSVAIGIQAGMSNQGSECIALGDQAGKMGQGDYSIAIGNAAAFSNQGIYSIGMGPDSGAYNQGDKCLALGFAAGFSTQGTYSIALGSEAAYNNQSTSSVAIGNRAAYEYQNINAIAIGTSAGATNQGPGCIAIGLTAGYHNIAGIYNTIAIGTEAGRSNQSIETIAIGEQAGKLSQGQYAVALGAQAGLSTQGEFCVAIGQGSGTYNQKTYGIAIGNAAGSILQGCNAIALGNVAAISTQGEYSIALGAYSGAYGQGEQSIAIGNNAGCNAQGTNCVAIGNIAGISTQGTYSVAVGAGCGSLGQGVNSVAIGTYSGNEGQGDYAVAIGNVSGQSTQSTYAIAIGSYAGHTGQEDSAISIGSQAGAIGQRINSIAIGQFAGFNIQGSNSIAIGAFAGSNTMHESSIILSATGSPLNSISTSSFYVAPIRGDETVGLSTLSYNPRTYEITYGPASGMSQSISTFNELYTSSLTVSSIVVEASGSISTPALFTNYISTFAISALSSINDQPYLAYPGSTTTTLITQIVNTSSIFVSTVIVDALGYISTPMVFTNYLSTFAIGQLSSINDQPYLYYPGLQSTLSTFNDLYTSSLNVSSIVVNTNGSISTPALLANYISTFAISALSSINDQPYLAYPGSTTTTLITQIVNTSSIFVSTVIVDALGYISAPIIFTNYLSTFAINELSSVNNQPYVAYPGLLSTFNELYTSTLSVSTITLYPNGYINGELAKFSSMVTNSLLVSTLSVSSMTSLYVSTTYITGVSTLDAVSISSMKGNFSSLTTSTITSAFVYDVLSLTASTISTSEVFGKFLTMSSINTSSISSCYAYLSSLYAPSLSSLMIGTSSITASTIKVDAGYISSIYSEGISTLFLNNVSSIQTSSIVSGRGLFSTIDCPSISSISSINGLPYTPFNSSNTTINNLITEIINTSTIYVSTVVVDYQGYISTPMVFTNYISTFAIGQLSSVNNQPYIYYPGPTTPTFISSFNELFTSSITVSTIIAPPSGFVVSTIRSDLSLTVSTLSYNIDTNEVTYGAPLILPRIQYLTDPWVAQSSQFSIPGPAGGGMAGFDQPGSIYMSSILVSQSNLNYSLASIAVMENQIDTQADIIMGIFQDNAFMGISTVNSAAGIAGFNQVLAINYGGLVYNSATPIDIRLYNATGSGGDVVILTGSMNTIYNLSYA